MLHYWDGAVEKYGKYENIYTVGLRGADDYPMAGADTPQGMAKILEDVFAEQRKILTDRLGKPADQIPQVFTPYKEVLPAYDAGLKVPDDVTLTWPDDNFGYIRRLSNAQERHALRRFGRLLPYLLLGRADVVPLAGLDPSRADVGGNEQGLPLRRAPATGS